jgi:hypothetical protein
MFEKMSFKSVKDLLECAQSLLDNIDEKMKNVKELMDMNHFNQDYCVDNMVIKIFKELEQIKKFQTKANEILFEVNSLR